MMLNFIIYGDRKASEVSGVLCWGHGETGRHPLLWGLFHHHTEEETDAHLYIPRAETPTPGGKLRLRHSQPKTYTEVYHSPRAGTSLIQALKGTALQQ